MAPATVTSPPSTSPLEGSPVARADSANQTCTSSPIIDSRETSSWSRLTELANIKLCSSTEYLRWRPRYHLQAPHGWMNDPCAPGYDSTTGLYHLFFQWNPKRDDGGSVTWGSICWGHATSRDMVSWTIDSRQTIKSDAWYDRKGCFTGCMVSTNLKGGPGMTFFYTGISRLPLHFSLPYVAGTETLAVFQPSNTGGFVKMVNNPLLVTAPEGLNITGFRDPFVSSWPSMDKILDRTIGKSLYAVISGGIRSASPTAFLYGVESQDLLSWNYIGPLADVGLNHNISRWSGDLGINWECANFMTLTSKLDGSSRDFIIVGAEGADSVHPYSTNADHTYSSNKLPRMERSLQWMCGRLELIKGGLASTDVTPQMRYISGGRFDHGLMYAVNSFRDPLSEEQIAWGWITEEDLPQSLIDKQGWSGVISVPRELSLIVIQHVTGTLCCKLQDITSFELEPESDLEACTVRTLGISPASCLTSLRHNAHHIKLERVLLLPLQNSVRHLDIQTYCFELAASLALSDTVTRIGLSVFHTLEREAEQSTRIYLDIPTETIKVTRPDSTRTDPAILTYAESGPFTLLQILDRGSGATGREELKIHAFFDESVLEVFVNDRCTFASRIYPATKTCYGVGFWADDENQGGSMLIGVEAWDGIRADMRVS